MWLSKLHASPAIYKSPDSITSRVTNQTLIKEYLWNWNMRFFRITLQYTQKPAEPAKLPLLHDSRVIIGRPTTVMQWNIEKEKHSNLSWIITGLAYWKQIFQVEDGPALVQWNIFVYWLIVKGLGLMQFMALFNLFVKSRRHFPSMTAICRFSNILQRLTVPRIINWLIWAQKVPKEE